MDLVQVWHGHGWASGISNITISKILKSLILLFRVEVSISWIVLTGLRKSQQDFLKQTQIRVAAILEREWFLVTFFPKALTA